MEPTEHEIKDLARQFLLRVQLSGQEVPAFNTVMQWLTTPEPEVGPTE